MSLEEDILDYQPALLDPSSICGSVPENIIFSPLEKDNQIILVKRILSFLLKAVKTSWKARYSQACSSIERRKTNNNNKRKVP